MLWEFMANVYEHLQIFKLKVWRVHKAWFNDPIQVSIALMYPLQIKNNIM
jgi:hypothetical protein